MGWQAHGWGLHIIEGPNGAVLTWMIVAGVMVSFLAAVVWSAAMRDVQGGFGIAAFVIAAQSTLMFAFFRYNLPGEFGGG